MKFQNNTTPAFLTILLTTFLTCLSAYEMAIAQTGSGGDILQDGEYTIHTFYENDTFTPPAGMDSVEVLVVGGGGGGGGANAKFAAGGGGAGGLRYVTNYGINGPVSVVVGQGGAGGTGNRKGEDGLPSFFDGLAAIGGGGGGAAPGNALPGSPGGSGGGGGAMKNKDGQGGNGTAGQGNDGGSALGGVAGGGGGGAGTAGGDATVAAAGNGGDGLSYSQFFHAGVGGWFAGGGGGGALDESSAAGSSGIGGGGAGGGENTPGASAAANTGGGGGGSGGGGSLGGDGGSGIVIVRYRTPENTIIVNGDISLTIGPAGISLAGLGHDPVDDDTATLSWTSAPEEGGTNKITVRIVYNTVPAGLELSVDTDLPGVDPVVLDGTPQDFITGIAGESVSGQALTYTLAVTDFGALFAASEAITVEYTITAEP